MTLHPPDKFVDLTKGIFVLFSQQIYDLHDRHVLTVAHGIRPPCIVLIDPAASVAKLPPPGLAWAGYSLSHFKWELNGQKSFSQVQMFIANGHNFADLSHFAHKRGAVTIG